MTSDRFLFRRPHAPTPSCLTRLPSPSSHSRPSAVLKYFFLPVSCFLCCSKRALGAVWLGWFGGSYSIFTHPFPAPHALYLQGSSFLRRLNIITMAAADWILSLLHSTAMQTMPILLTSTKGSLIALRIEEEERAAAILKKQTR